MLQSVNLIIFILFFLHIVAMLDAPALFQLVCAIYNSYFFSLWILEEDSQFIWWIFEYFAVPPAYYAHLAAFRARYYMEADQSDASTSHGDKSHEKPVAIRMLPTIKENVKDVMFYCWLVDVPTTSL